jgi:hypothetical protein
MENQTMFICWVHGERSSFPVFFDPEKTIGELKMAILAQERSISVTSARELGLFAAMIPDTEEAMADFSFVARRELRGAQKIKVHFRQDFLEPTIHFAIGKQYSFVLSTHIC